MTHVIGHRGASRVAPENTIAAFRAAAELGADGVEFDVRRTADGHLAIHHDAHLPDGRAIAETMWADIPAHVPDLEAALGACRGLAIVNVEIKNWPDDVDFDPSLAIVDLVVDVLLAGPPAERGALLVSCFHLPTIDRVREAAPELSTAWLVVGPGADGGTTRGVDGAASVVAEAAGRGHRALHPHHAFVSPELVAAAHDADLAVNTWTCDEPDRIVWLADVGVDGIVTNAPDVALTALGRPVGTSSPVTGVTPRS